MAQRVIFSGEARADIRAIDRDTALRLFKSLACLLETEAGDVKQLQGFDPPQYRFRIGASSFAESARRPLRSSAFAIVARLTAKPRRTNTEHDTAAPAGAASKPTGSGMVSYSYFNLQMLQTVANGFNLLQTRDGVTHHSFSRCEASSSLDTPRMSN
jgi:hypothetical protein